MMLTLTAGFDDNGTDMIRANAVKTWSASLRGWQ